MENNGRLSALYIVQLWLFVHMYAMLILYYLLCEEAHVTSVLVCSVHKCTTSLHFCQPIQSTGNFQFPISNQTRIDKNKSIEMILKANAS